MQDLVTTNYSFKIWAKFQQLVWFGKGMTTLSAKF